MSDKFELSYETFNMDAFKALPAPRIKAGYAVEKDSMGSCCFLDPPGYPSYFLRQVYSKHGNPPSDGTTEVLALPGVGVKETQRGEVYDQDAHKATLRKLYKPLSIEHPRVQAWIRYVFGYFASMYEAEDGNVEVSDLVNHKFVPHYDNGFPGLSVADNESWRVLSEEYPVSRYRPVSYVREYYPDFLVDDEVGVEAYVENPGYGCGSGNGDWWERYNRKPTVDECPGLHGTPHPASGDDRCQFCGWVREEEKEAVNG